MELKCTKGKHQNLNNTNPFIDIYCLTIYKHYKYNYKEKTLKKKTKKEGKIDHDQ